MKQFIYLKEAIECLKANRLRSFLALLGLLIGTTSVVALITIGFLAKQAAIEQFKNLGTQKLLLHVNSEHNDDLIKLNNTILENDLKRNIFNPSIISDYHPLLSFFKSVYYEGLKLQSYQIGITNSLNDSLKLKLASGRFINDNDKLRYYVVVGNDVVKEVQQEKNITLKVGDNLNIDDNVFIIVGILKHWPIDPLFSYNINRSILIPLSTAQYLSNKYFISEVYIDVNNNTQPKVAETYLNNLIKHIIPYAKTQFINAEQILDQLEKQARILTILLGTIGAISLLVGAIGVMNIMLVAVIERRAEIGLRMAIGATPQEIKLQFLCETICLTSIGGLIGTLLGIAIPAIIAYFAEWSFTLPVSSVVFGLSVSFGVGITAGFYPASKASKTLPVECF